MSWQNTWGTVKATNARAIALYHEISNVGKMVEASKKRVTWRLKVEEGKEYEISLTHSLASGKKVLRVDGIVKYTAKAMSIGDWDYVFNLPGGHVVHIIIKPSVDLNDMYDLIIDNVSFRRLPDRFDPNRANPSSSQPSYTYQGYTPPQSGSNSRNSSFTPWECTRCTLVNDKPLAPVCEACGNPKPAYITPASAARAKSAVEQRQPTPVSRASSTTRSQQKEADLLGTTSDSESGFNPFGTEAASAFGTSDPFAATHAAAAPPSASSSTAKKTEDITSMLSGLDFNTVPTPPPMATFQDYTRPPLSPNPADDANSTEQRTASGDLWDSKIVDLNLNPKAAKPKPTSIRAHQTLEQSRQSSFKEKVPVMAPPPPAPPVVPMGYYNTAAPGAMYHQGSAGAFGTTMGSAMAAYGGGSGMMMPMGMPQHQQQQQQQFMTAAPMYHQQPSQQSMPPKQPVFYGADPFATLS